MRIVVGDLWEMNGYKIIPVNLTTNAKGHAVMGRGVARQAVDKYPSLPRLYGTFLRERRDRENWTNVFIERESTYILVPVKHHWKDKADLDLIKRSLLYLMAYLPEAPIFLPLLGCGFGELEPVPVLTALASMLPDNFILVLKNEEVAGKYPSSFVPGARQDRTV